MAANIKKLTNPAWVLAHLCRYFPFRLVSDETYLKLLFRGFQGFALNLKSPQTFNEKLQWLKLYYRNPLYPDLTDKYRVRKYIAEKIGDKYLIPLLGMWKSADSIDFESLPDQFVLKCNHDSGSVIVCRDKSQFDIAAARKKLSRALGNQFFWKHREWNYREIDRCIVAEKFITDQSSDELTDYKYFCFDGKPQFIQVDSGRFTDHIRNYYDTGWNFIDVQYGCKNDSGKKDMKPAQHEEMMRLASVLSEGFPHVRVDFYVSGENIYFGELTFHHGGGVMPVSPIEYDYEWGKLLRLPPKSEQRK